MKQERSKRVRRNHEIKVREVRVIDDDGGQHGVMRLEEALKMAREGGLDLVEVSPNAEPPVCRVMDFGKYQFQESKKAQSARRNQKKTVIKEIKFRPVTEEGDYQTKLKKIIKFLEKGDKTKITIRFRGREMAHKDLGKKMIDRIQDDTKDIAEVEQVSKMEGRQMIAVLSPKRS